MIFKETSELMLKRLKWQTRRPVKPGDMASHDEHGDIVAVYRKGRLLWKVGETYAVQPGRGKKAVGRTPPIREIRRERLQEITPQAAKAEGAKNYHFHHGAYMEYGYEQGFINIWDSIYHNTPYEWRHDPEVWVLKFKTSSA